MATCAAFSTLLFATLTFALVLAQSRFPVEKDFKRSVTDIDMRRLFSAYPTPKTQTRKVREMEFKTVLREGFKNAGQMVTKNALF